MEPVWTVDGRYQSKKDRPDRNGPTGLPVTDRSTGNDRSIGKPTGQKNFQIRILSLDSDNWGS
jgi:hypothetical protein